MTSTTDIKPIEVKPFRRTGKIVPHHDAKGDLPMAKKSRGGRMTAAKKRAAKKPGGKGPVKKRKVGRKIMKT